MSDYISPELISNILVSLPVDDVLRCTSVCKSWYDLITSSSFISLHLKLSPANHEPRLLVRYRTNIKSHSKVRCKVHRDNKTFNEIAELNFPFTFNSKMIGSINGLFCLLDSERVFLWNPSLRKSLMLPDFKLRNNYAVSFGFCFLPERNDYKIVRLLLSRVPTTDSLNVEIYELSTNSWRNVSVPQVSYRSVKSDGAAVFLKGRLHWGVIIRRETGRANFGRSIVSFDTTNENLGILSVPSCLDNRSSDHFHVSTFEESLSLIHSTVAHWDMWVMKNYGAPDSWTMQFRIDKGDHGLSRSLYFRENGEILFKKALLGLADDRLVSYNLTSNQATNIGTYKNSFGIGVTTYMESLVLIKSLNQVLYVKSKKLRLH